MDVGYQKRDPYVRHAVEVLVPLAKGDEYLALLKGLGVDPARAANSLAYFARMIASRLQREREQAERDASWKRWLDDHGITSWKYLGEGRGVPGWRMSTTSVYEVVAPGKTKDEVSRAVGEGYGKLMGGVHWMEVSPKGPDTFAVTLGWDTSD